MIFQFCLFFRLSIDSVTGAQTSIYLAVDEAVANTSGAYFDNCKEKKMNKWALDNDLCRRVWDTTVEAIKQYID